MKLPEWLHPIVRKVLSNLSHDEWTKVGRPVLSPDVMIAQGEIQSITGSEVVVVLEEPDWNHLTPGASVSVIVKDVK